MPPTSPRYLTKSRFKLALECPVKLYYTGKKEVYYDTKFDNDFLAALAEGGFQVGELAKCYYRGGVEVEELDYDTALNRTNELMKQENVIIYEAAFLYKNLFIRADILEKKGKSIRLLEVKAKSFDPTTDSFTTNKGIISSKWEPYLYDVAFQKYVIQKSFPDHSVFAYLLLSDKSVNATVDGLNQLFFISQEGGRYKVKTSRTFDPAKLGNRIMTEQNVDDLCMGIINGEAVGFEQLVENYSQHYAADSKMPVTLGTTCGTCEFRPNVETLTKGFKSGFNECWAATKLSQDKIDNDLILSLWDFRKKQEYIDQGKFLLADLTREDLEPKAKKKGATDPWLSRVDRQMLQVDKSRNKDNSAFIDTDNLKSIMSSWRFPLHFIDFETTSVAIPFNAGRRPYEQIAFQFSHHIIKADGSIEHKSEWISTKIGSFPNFDFVRALKKELEQDNGTIFRFAAHENTILNVIYRQLAGSAEKDVAQLCAWIKTITNSTKSSAETWSGDRNMVDLRDIILKYYFNPLTKGSNSIKQVLPAMLQTSAFLQEKYSQPIYGTTISSHNYKDHAWITLREGKVVNPYELLPPIHTEASNETMDEFLVDEETGIADGGAAMIAFARMQFTEMTEEERKRIQNALLRYCELDTFAMVMIYEAFKEWCK
jgi:Domain of unknown function(DUF2779)